MKIVMTSVAAISVRTRRVFGLETGNGKLPFGEKFPAGKREMRKKFPGNAYFLLIIFYAQITVFCSSKRVFNV